MENASAHSFSATLTLLLLGSSLKSRDLRLTPSGLLGLHQWWTLVLAPVEVVSSALLSCSANDHIELFGGLWSWWLELWWWRNVSRSCSFIGCLIQRPVLFRFSLWDGSLAGVSIKGDFCFNPHLIYSMHYVYLLPIFWCDLKFFRTWLDPLVMSVYPYNGT